MHRQGGDDLAPGIAADELQQHRPGLRGADPTQHRAEPVRQVLGTLGEISHRLA
jgi:PP-loop superfamily ATP-utilizing enzyme